MSGPDTPWWRAAIAMEQADRLDEAEETIRLAMKDDPWPAQIAHLYSLRLARLRDAGDAAEARDAYDRAVRWIRAYASGATSGGEGVALSREADAFVRALGARP